MIISEIEKILDRQCIFSFTSESRVSNFLTEHGVTAVVRVRPNSSGGFAVFNFETSSVDSQILQDWDERDGEIDYDEESVTIKLDLSGTKFISTFKSLNEVPSVIIDCIIFNGGYFYLYLRFHSNDEEMLGKVVRGQISMYSKFAIRYLGSNVGVINTFRDISDAVPLRYIEMKSKVPPNYMDLVRDNVISSLGISWAREMKYLSEGEFRAVFYDKESMMKKNGNYIEEISEKQKIYETSFTNPLLEAIITETSQKSVVTLGMIQKLQGREFTFATVVPDIVLSRFFAIALDICLRFPEWNVSIQNVDVFDGIQE
jgi:hypothetical protein